PVTRKPKPLAAEITELVAIDSVTDADMPPFWGSGASPSRIGCCGASGRTDPCAQMRDEPARGAVGVGRQRGAVGERRDNGLRERLAVFDAEFVERVDPVEHRLDEGPMLVE